MVDYREAGQPPAPGSQEPPESAKLVADVICMVIFLLLYAVPVMLLWNIVVPDVSRGCVTPLSYYQALCVTSLCVTLSRIIRISLW